MKLPPNDCLSLEEMSIPECFVLFICLFMVWGSGLVFWPGGCCFFVLVWAFFGRDTEPEEIAW